jgi:hypothetical protein
MIVSNTAEWDAALNLIKNGGNGSSEKPKNYTVVINGNIAVSGSTANSFGSVTNIIIKLNGNGKLYLTNQGRLLTIGNSQTVFIDSAGLTLQGLKTGQNGSIQNNNSLLVYVDSSGKLELRNGNIIGNADFVGGIYVSNNSSFTMSGGEISSNTVTVTSSGDGGGVYCSGSGTFTMINGTISGNIAGWGGGVKVGNDNSTFTMSGSEISGNTASSFGGGVSVNGTFTKNGGTIYGYTSGNNKSNVVNYKGTVQSGSGHAVYVDITKKRETTVGSSVNLDSSFPGAVGGWQ